MLFPVRCLPEAECTRSKVGFYEILTQQVNALKPDYKDQSIQ